MEIVAKLGIRREEGYLYYLLDTDVMRTRMKLAGETGRPGSPERVASARFEREEGYLYYITSDGDIARSKRAVGNSRPKQDDEDEDDGDSSSTVEVVANLGLRREPGLLYYIKGSDVMSAPLKRAGEKYRRGKKRVARGEFRREPGYLYYLNGDGDVARTKMAQLRPRAERAQSSSGIEIVAVLGVRRKKGYLYFITNSDVMRVPMKRAGDGRSPKIELVAKGNFRRQEGYLYFLDQNGDVARAKRAVASE